MFQKKKKKKKKKERKEIATNPTAFAVHSLIIELMVFALPLIPYKRWARKTRYKRGKTRHPLTAAAIASIFSTPELESTYVSFCNRRRGLGGLYVTIISWRIAANSGDRKSALLVGTGQWVCN